MTLPFTTDEFLDVFRRYNEAVWPAQWALLALGVLAVVLALRAAHGRRGGRAAMLVLALLWAWMGLVYHVGFFAAINPAATAFGALFVVQAALLARVGLARDALAFDVRPDARGALGIALVTYALVLYPLLGVLLGHRYPHMATFGLPCPTTILTLGLLAWAAPHVSRVLFAIPLLWSAIATSAATLLGMREDYGLGIAGLVGAWVVLRHGHPTVQRGPRPA